MPYLIDGHNLIGQMPGLSLSDPDDELKLIELLRRFCLRTRRKVTVYFDHRAPGSSDPPTSANLTVRFIARPRTADQAIRSELKRLRGRARNWTVVSSDRAVQAEARAAGAQSIASQAFAAELAARPTAPGDQEKPEAPLDPDELAHWERLFTEPEDEDPS